MGNDTLQLMAAQWRLCRIQLVNWGTFDGYTDLPIRPSDDVGNASVVCVTGKSGTGKSTLFDAGTVLMMPYGRTLNAASNLARGGSPREVRTYLKGMIDTVADERGRARGKYLRDDTAPIWSAIVHTWQDDTGSLFSAARFFQLRPGGGDNDLEQSFVTTPGPLDPRALRHHAAERFRPQTLRSVYEGCTVHEGSGKFFRCVYLTLGIGKDGDGTNAMKLLYRIQSGIPMTNVDDLFKELVLDPPSTFELAQEAIDSYDKNEGVWAKIDEAKRRRDALSGIDETYARLGDARTAQHLIESLDHRAPHGPFRLWMEQHRLELVEAEIESQRRALERCEANLAQAEHHRADLRARLASLQQSIFEHGGGERLRLRSELERHEAGRSQVVHRRSGLASSLRRVDRELPDNADEWEALAGWAEQVLATDQDERESLQERIDDAGIRLRSLRTDIGDREEDLDYLRTHRVRITQPMVKARAMLAEAAGLDPTDIPFAAEIMDVPLEQERWRTAVNISLAHIADRILVDKRLEGHFRRSVDHLAKMLGRRYHYDFVDLDGNYPCSPKAGHVSSKVIYRDDSPFAPYVRSLVCGSTDHLCVDTVPQLAGGGARITPSGQERVGNRGAIGHSANTIIIGFTNEGLIEERVAELEAARTRERDLLAERSGLQAQRELLDGRRLAAQGVLDTRWSEIDLASLDAHIAQIREDLDRIEHDGELRTLNDLLARTQAESDGMVARCDRLKGERDAHAHTIRDHEATERQGRILVEGLERTGIALTQEQANLCQEATAQTEQTLADRAAVVAGFDRVESQAKHHLDARLADAEERVRRGTETLSKTFATYHDTFMPDDGEHGTGVDEYPYYHGVLARLTEEGLDEPEEEWEAEMLRDVTRHLSRLQDAFVTEERALDDRLRPVNDILGQFVFGERGGRLGVVSQHVTMADVTAFRRTLRKLTALATTYDFADATQIRREHRALGRFIDLLRRDLATTGKSARYFLDIRHRVRITALETPAPGIDAEPVVYDSINGKSGGQYQELVAFILGAALLYCLGYNSATTPSYAPVFLDEAFIKADSEHTRRALRALSGLGFQVIIGVPDGKVEAVAPLAAQIIGLTKDERSNVTSAKSLLRVATDDEADDPWQG